MTEQLQQKRQLLLILLIVFLGFVGISIPYLIFPALFLNPAYSILSSSWGASGRALLLGVTLAAYPLGQFFGSPILGSLSDDYGRKRLLAGSLFITAISNIFTGLAIEWGQLTLLIASRFIAGFMEGNIAIARAMAANLSTLSKHKSFGKINAAASIAYLLGPLLGGLMTEKELFERFTTSTPFYFICLLFFFLSLLSLFMLKGDRMSSSSESQTIYERLNFIKNLSSLFSNQRLRFLMITSTCFTLAVDIFYEFGPVYLTVKWSLSPAQLVFYNAALCFGLAIGNGWLPTFTSSWVSNRLAVIYSIGGFALFLMGMILTDSSPFMISLFAFNGLAIGLAVTLLTVKISNSVPDSIQGEVMGTQVSLRVLGDAMICLFGGVLLLFSSKLILFFAVILATIATFYYIYFSSTVSGGRTNTNESSSKGPASGMASKL